MKMGIVEQAAYWDSDCENVMDLFNVLDFPGECLDGDGFIDEFDASKLGPIPSDALTAFFPVPQSIIRNDSSNAALKLKPSVNSVSQCTQLQNDVDENSSKIFLAQNKYLDAHEAGTFQTQSPVSVLESSASCSGGKAMAIKNSVIVPVRPRTRRTRPAKINPWLLVPPFSSTAFDSKKTSTAKKKRERKPSQKSNAMKEARNASSDTVVKKCTHCEVTKTPQWREGPMGPKTLCNACGVRYRSGRLFPEYRPAASPTFVASLHSNSHRKVIEMRKKAEAEDSCEKVVETSENAVFQESNAIDDPPMSPLPEFIPMSSYLFDCI